MQTQTEKHTRVLTAKAASLESAGVLPGLCALFRELDRWTGRIPLEVLGSGLERLDLSRDDLSAFSLFGCECYQRNQIRSTAPYEALLLCWQPGQRSPIHDHRGSGCAFRVVRGEGVEVAFTEQREGLRRGAMRRLPEGFVCASNEDDIHEVANESESPLMTLHIYSPALEDMRLFERDRVIEERH